jgi:hypothetical protein
MGVPPNVHLLQAALAAQNPGAAMAPVPEPPPAVRAMDVVWSVNNPDDRGECSRCTASRMEETARKDSRNGVCPFTVRLQLLAPYDPSCHAGAGLVWRVAGETDSEADDSEYEDEEDYIPPGHARVTWCASVTAARVPHVQAALQGIFVCMAGSGVAAAVETGSRVRSTAVKVQGLEALPHSLSSTSSTVTQNLSQEALLCLVVDCAAPDYALSTLQTGRHSRAVCRRLLCMSVEYVVQDRAA